MKTVAKGKLKARMLEYFREVESTGESLIVTDRGREVLEVRPVKQGHRTAEEFLAAYRAGTEPKKGISEEELMKPLPWDDWEALRDDDRNPW